MADPTASLSRTNRNLIERERRSEMRLLLSTLVSVLPPRPKKMPMHQVVENATVYVKQLQERVEELNLRKVKLESETTISPALEITDSDSESTMEVNLIATTTSALCDIITILEEEGAEVVSVNYHKDGNRIRLSVHSQAAYSRIGIENL